MKLCIFRIIRTTFFFMLLFTTGSLYAQSIRLINENRQGYTVKEKVAKVATRLDRNAIYTLGSGAIIAADFYTKQTGFFCNTERALEKKTKIPLKFRLGSLSYTEKLEGY